MATERKRLTPDEMRATLDTAVRHLDILIEDLETNKSDLEDVNDRIENIHDEVKVNIKDAKKLKDKLNKVALTLENMPLPIAVESKDRFRSHAQSKSK